MPHVIACRYSYSKCGVKWAKYPRSGFSFPNQHSQKTPGSGLSRIVFNIFVQTGMSLVRIRLKNLFKTHWFLNVALNPVFPILVGNTVNVWALSPEDEWTKEGTRIRWLGWGCWTFVQEAAEGKQGNAIPDTRHHFKTVNIYTFPNKALHVTLQAKVKRMDLFLVLQSGKLVVTWEKHILKCSNLKGNYNVLTASE